MPAPKGNQYAKGCKTSGTPKTWTDDIIEEWRLKLLAWSDTDEAYQLLNFLADFGIERDTLLHFCSINEEFGKTYRLVKYKIGKHRTIIAMHNKNFIGDYLKNQGNYDPEHLAFGRADKEFDAELAVKHKSAQEKYYEKQLEGLDDTSNLVKKP